MGVAVVGSTNADLIVRAQRHPGAGETVLGHDMQMRSGGKGANQAVAAAHHGAEVRFVGAVGSDEFAEAAQAGLRAAGVDLSGLRQVPGPTGLAVVTVDEDGENSIVVIPGANGTLDAAAVSAQAELWAAAEVVVLQGEIPRQGIEEVALRVGGRLVLNLAPAIEVSAETLRRADPLVVNEHEAVHAARLLGAPEEQLRGAPEEQPPGAPAGRLAAGLAALRWLVAAGVPSVVMTAGPSGAFLEIHGQEELLHRPAPAVEAVDTTGAGDAFVGALAAALDRGTPLETAVDDGVEAGAAAVQVRGAQPAAS